MTNNLTKRSIHLVTLAFGDIKVAFTLVRFTLYSFSFSY